MVNPFVRRPSPLASSRTIPLAIWQIVSSGFPPLFKRPWRGLIRKRGHVLAAKKIHFPSVFTDRGPGFRTSARGSGNFSPLDRGLEKRIAATGGSPDLQRASCYFANSQQASLPGALSGGSLKRSPSRRKCLRSRIEPAINQPPGTFVPRRTSLFTENDSLGSAFGSSAPIFNPLPFCSFDS